MKIKWGGVNRSTPIDLKTLDSEIANIAGRSPRTPIGMKELWDEVQSLKTTMKQWEIVTLRGTGDYSNFNFPFDSKYTNWNFQVISGTLTKNENRISINRNTLSTYNMPQNLTASWIKSGNTIKANGASAVNSGAIIVLFYK